MLGTKRFQSGFFLRFHFPFIVENSPPKKTVCFPKSNSPVGVTAQGRTHQGTMASRMADTTTCSRETLEDTSIEEAQQRKPPCWTPPRSLMWMYNSALTSSSGHPVGLLTMIAEVCPPCHYWNMETASLKHWSHCFLTAKVEPGHKKDASAKTWIILLRLYGDSIGSVNKQVRIPLTEMLFFPCRGTATCRRHACMRLTAEHKHAGSCQHLPWTMGTWNGERISISCGGWHFYCSALQFSSRRRAK